MLSFACVDLGTSSFCQLCLNLSFIVLAESKTPYSPYSLPLWYSKTWSNLSQFSLQIIVSGLLNFLKQLLHFCSVCCPSLYFLAVSFLRWRDRMHDVGEAKFNLSVFNVLYVVWYMLFSFCFSLFEVAFLVMPSISFVASAKSTNSLRTVGSNLSIFFSEL